VLLTFPGGPVGMLQPVCVYSSPGSLILLCWDLFGLNCNRCTVGAPPTPLVTPGIDNTLSRALSPFSGLSWVSGAGVCLYPSMRGFFLTPP